MDRAMRSLPAPDSPCSSRLVSTAATRRAWASSAFIASLLIGLLESFGKVSDLSGATVLGWLGVSVAPDNVLQPVLALSLSQVAPVLPYLLLVLVLIVRPKGLLGTREG